MNTTNQKRINSSDRNVGIDVGKDTLDVYVFELDLHS
jgi:transposase